MKYLKILSAVAASVLSVTVAPAQTPTTAFQETRIRTVASSSAMAGASISNVDSRDYNINPSLILFSEYKGGIGAGWTQWMPGDNSTRNFNLNTGFIVGDRIGICASLDLGIGKEYEVYKEEMEYGGTFTPKNVSGVVSVSYLATDDLAFGVNVNVCNQALSMEYGLNACFADAFLSWHKEALTLSGGVRGLGPKVKSQGGDKFSLPASAVLSGAYSLGFAGQHKLLADVDADYFFAGGFSIAAGLQYSFRDLLVARGGYHFSSGKVPLPSYASAGLGIRIKTIELSASMVFASEILNKSFNIGISKVF